MIPKAELMAAARAYIHGRTLSKAANRMRTLELLCLMLGYSVMSATSLAAEDNAAARSQIDADGVAHLSATTVPTSRFMSAVARTTFIKLFSHPEAPAASNAAPDFHAMREADEYKNAPYEARAETLFPVNIKERVIGAVRTQVITPKAGVAPANRARVLINLHGGGFLWGEGNGARVESIPIAGLGRITVVTVAYRMAPEFKFPAASEDVTSVYRELLKDHRPENIGIYGCSAGGVLTGEAIAWFDKEKLPLPGAIGTFCGSIASMGGDSSHIGPLLVGDLPIPDADSGSMSSNPYFSDASAADPLVLPINSPKLLRRFPPTLLIGGSRDFMVSSLFTAQAALASAGADAELHVWDGMWHAFFFDPDLPESQQVYRVVVKFFERHLGHAAPARSVPGPPTRG